jgi:DNA-binding transcriptional LysR family regulator
MTASSQGVTLIPSLAAAVENRRSTLALRPFQQPQPSRPILLVWRRDAANAAALRAMAHLMSGILETLQASPLP